MDKQDWHRTIGSQPYLVSTKRELISTEFVQEAFDTDAMSWATRMTTEETNAMLDRSCTLGLYRIEEASETCSHTNSSDHAVTSQRRVQIGMARLITDTLTFAWLTDVYMVDESRGVGLGRWLVQCCREAVVAMPRLRFLMLLTGSPNARQMYAHELGMEVVGEAESFLKVMAVRKGKLAEAGSEAQQRQTIHNPSVVGMCTGSDA